MAVKTLDIDTLIDIFNELAQSKNEMGEQEGDAAAASTTTSSGGGAGYPSVTKWETGIKRGAANQIGNTKWKDSYTITRGKANTLL
jgi:hypothetical protein